MRWERMLLLDKDFLEWGFSFLVMVMIGQVMANSDYIHCCWNVGAIAVKPFGCLSLAKKAAYLWLMGMMVGLVAFSYVVYSVRVL